MSLQRPTPALPSWLTWWQRPFPDANTLLLPGRRPALVDTGFVGHADETAAWARAHAGTVDLVVNTHWHSDHVGGNALLQARGAAVAAGVPEAEAITRRDPGCCAAEYLDQPVAPYTVDLALDDGQFLRLGDADWEVVRTPGHTPGRRRHRGDDHPRYRRTPGTHARPKPALGSRAVRPPVRERADGSGAGGNGAAAGW